MAPIEISKRMLTPRDWFGVAVRCMGLVCFYHAVSYFLYFLDMRLGLSDSFGTVEPKVPTGFLVYVAAYVVSGTFVLRTSDAIVAFTYGSDERATESNE
ncbi:hypothetical protein Pla22_33900 [Rubripirellula amarantea]|uniref:Uncharacterized protein n=1 Tax=Rubripirellula amarantea TaxID=2527999 RepID=A0A5C5WJB5_9BACT|nr:hypothetical protein [Rubripirellula amarantea]TWT50647.1 hypothetical protein Pla22_33900 [Rubripirellula amarantea]